MMTMMTPLGGWGVWDLNDDMMSQQNKVAAAMIYHPLFMIFILILTLLANKSLSFIARFGLGPSWAIIDSISANPSSQKSTDLELFPGQPQLSGVISGTKDNFRKYISANFSLLNSSLILN